jgi:hypothetical protein
VKDDLVDAVALAAEFDEKSLQFDNAKFAALLRLEAMGRLVVGLQHKPAFAIQCHAMGRGPARECGAYPAIGCRRAAMTSDDAARLLSFASQHILALSPSSQMRPGTPRTDGPNHIGMPFQTIQQPAGPVLNI